MKVIPIRDTGPSVETVLLDVMSQADDFRSTLVAVVTKEGEILCWSSGRNEDVCALSLMMTEYAKAHLRGDIEYEYYPTDPGPENEP